MAKSYLKLWSERYSHDRGWHWKLEREVNVHNQFQWLEVFRKDEPGVLFVIGANRPRDRNKD